MNPLHAAEDEALSGADAKEPPVMPEFGPSADTLLVSVLTAVSCIKGQGHAVGLLTHAAVAELIAQLDRQGAARVLERIVGDLRRYHKDNLREFVLNHVDQEKYG